MRVISRRALREFWESHAGAETALKTWFGVAKNADWKNIVEVQRTYASAESVEGWTIFNIKGNTFRLIVKIEYGLQIIYIKMVLTHAEYDKDTWK